MPSPPVVFHPEAIEDASETYEWYGERSVEAAELFLAELDRAIESIAAAPRRWPVYLPGTRRFLMRRFPFFVIYREIGERIQIVAVAHGRRKPGYWKAR